MFICNRSIIEERFLEHGKRRDNSVSPKMM